MTQISSFVISADVLIAAFSGNNRNKKVAIVILEKGLENNAYITEPDLIAFISHMAKKKPANELKCLVEDIQLVYKILVPSTNAVVGAISLIINKKIAYNEALLVEIMKENNLFVVYSFNLRPLAGLKVKRKYTGK